MKKLVSIFLLFIFSLSIFAQVDDYKKELYESKIESYKKMKKNGSTLMIVGAATTVISVVALSNVKFEEQTNYYTGETTYHTNQEGQFMAGVLGVTLGGSAFIGGIILNSIGNRKLKEYSNKLENLSFNINPSIKQPGFQLVYRF